MYIKGALIAAVAAASAAAAGASETVGQNQISAHRQFKVEDQICVTKQPITACQHGFQPIYDQENQRSVEMYCLEQSHPLADQMQQVMETGHRLQRMQQEGQKRTLRVPKVTRCKTTRLTKNGEVEDDAEATTSLSFSNFNRSKFGSKHQQYQTKQERKQQYENIRAEQQKQLQQLKKLMPSVEDAVKLSDSEFQEAYKLIKKIARQDEQIEGGLYMLSQYLPQAFVDAVQRIQNELVDDNMDENKKERVYEQLKKLSQRVYAYTLTRLVQEQQKQPISEQVEEGNYTNWEQFEEQFERLWHQIKREMESDKIAKIERQVERVFKQQIKYEEQKQLQAWQLTLQQQDKQFKQQQGEQKQPEQWNEKMTRQQRERQQLQLTKIIMAGLKTAQEMQKDQKHHATGAFSNLFSHKANYEQLAQQVKQQFQKTDF